MKSFRQLIAEVAQPKSEDELNFKDKHEIEFIDHPESEEHQHTAEKRSPKRRADYKEGEDMAVYETKLDPVNHKALKGDFEDREDKDIDNDGKVDDSDRYLHKRRQAISKAMKESFSVFKSMSPAPGKSVSNRAQVKAFKSANDMNTFLAKGDNALHWKPTDKSGLKSGTYKVDPKKGADGKIVRDFIREETDDEVEENAFIAKAAGAHKEGKKKFKLGDKEFPVTIKKDTAKKIVGESTELNESTSDKMISSLISAISKHSDKREFQKAGEIFELWAERYPGSYKKLLATPGIAGSFFSDLEEVLDIRVDLDEETGNKEADAIMSLSKIKRDAQKTRHGINRKPGESLAAFITRAQKHKAKMQKEEVEQIDEISKKTLGSYIKKASKQRGHAGIEVGASGLGSRDRKDAMQTMKKRLKGIEKATDKLTNESTELTENFKTGSLTLNDGSKVIVSKQNAALLNQMFSDLNPANRREMLKVAMTDKAGFDEILGFAKEAL
jgi:prefoldin subunit 5